MTSVDTFPTMKLPAWSRRPNSVAIALCAVNLLMRLYRFDFPIIGGWEHRFSWTAWGIRSIRRSGLNP
ncbi:MAG: hypothetical protein ACKO8J_01630, partial [Candidatus Limnocylindrus sp.]